MEANVEMGLGGFLAESAGRTWQAGDRQAARQAARQWAYYSSYYDYASAAKERIVDQCLSRSMR